MVSISDSKSLDKGSNPLQPAKLWKCTQVAIRGSPAKGVDGLNRARVRIPPSAPY